MEIRQRSGAAQPRPAFGLRPWFAFLRRARSLRRFAFAMGGRVLGVIVYRRLGPVTLASGDWRFEGVVVAASFLDRLVGMRRVPTQGLLLHTSSVHGVGLSAPLRLVHLTRSGVVAGHDVLSPRSAARASEYWLLEVPLATTPPPIGGQLVVVLPSSLR